MFELYTLVASLEETRPQEFLSPVDKAPTKPKPNLVISDRFKSRQVSMIRYGRLSPPISCAALVVGFQRPNEVH